MSTTNITEQIVRLRQDKTAICNAIKAKDESIEIPNDISYDGIAAKIALIDTCQCGGSGGDEPIPTPSGSDKIEYIDVDGSVLASFDVGETISADDVPTFPTHTGLTPVKDQSQNSLWSKTLAEVNALDHPENIYPRYTVDGDKLVIKVEIPENGADIELNEIYVPAAIQEGASVVEGTSPVGIWLDETNVKHYIEWQDYVTNDPQAPDYNPDYNPTQESELKDADAARYEAAIEYYKGKALIEAYYWNDTIHVWKAKQRSITVDWGEGAPVSHTFNANLYSEGYSDYSDLALPGYFDGHVYQETWDSDLGRFVIDYATLNENIYETRQDVDNELQDAVDAWEDIWKNSFDIEAFISDAVKISEGGSNGNDGWYKHHYNNAGSYTITIVCNQDQNPPQIGTETGTNEPIYWDDSKYCGLFVKGPQSNEHHSYGQSNNISSALKAQYQGTTGNGPEKAIVTNASIQYVKAIYLPKTFKFSWYLFEYDNDSDFYHYAFPTKDDGYVVVDDNWDCAPLYGLDSNPYPVAGTRKENPTQYYLFAKCNVYGINLQMIYYDNNEVAVPRFRMGWANAFKNSKLKAIHSISSIWANEPYMFAETNLKSTGSIKNRFYNTGTASLSNDEHWKIGETTTISDPTISYGFNEEIGDHAFFNAANLKNIVICGDHQNFDVANATYRNKPLYQRGITSIGQYAFAFTNSTTINRKIYIPTVIRAKVKPVAEMGVGIHNEPAYTQITIAGNAFDNNDGLEIYINDTATATKTASDEWIGTEYANWSVTVPLVTLTSALTATNVKLYVPSAKRNAYLQDSNWSLLGSNNIIAYDFTNN